jgi:ATP-dependent DNA ligase
MATRSGIQLAYPFEERRLRNEGRFQLRWQPPYIIQPKLNGERCRMIVESGRCLLLSSSEDIIPAVPHINQAGLGLPDGEYDGELYVHGLTWSEIHSIVSREQNLHPEYGKMEYHVFDLVSGNAQAHRLDILFHLRPFFKPPLHIVDTLIVHTLEEIMDCYDSFIDKGYEGFILRHLDAGYKRARTPAMMKFKPKQTDSYPIVLMYEAVDKDGTPKGMLGGFDCIDDMSTPFSVGAGKLTHDERRELWAQWLDDPGSFTGRLLEIEYQTMSDKANIPLFSRAVRILP